MRTLNNYFQSFSGGRCRCEDIEQDGENFPCEELVLLIVELEKCDFITKLPESSGQS